MPAPRLALGLSGRHLQALATDRALLARLDASPVVFALAGVDRIDGTGHLRTTTLDSSTTAAVLTARTSYAAFLVAAAPQRDHPYNLARRIASLDLLSGERSGLVLGITDGFVPAGPPGQEAWGGAGLAPGAPLGPATTRDATIAIRKLLQSWPIQSVVADLETKIFVRADEIRQAAHQGIFSTAGPLTVPAPAGQPVIASYADSVEAVRAAADVADLVILPSARPTEIEQAHRSLAAAGGAQFDDPSERPRLFVELRHSQETDPVPQVAAVDALGNVDGILLRPDESVEALVKLLETVLPRLTSARPGGSLRDRLGLPRPAYLLQDAPPAFPAPEPQPGPRLNELTFRW